MRCPGPIWAWQSNGRSGANPMCSRISCASTTAGMFRIARAILRNDAEAEDIVQDAFVKAFTELGSLRNSSSAAAWLAKITANLAISRVRLLKRRRRVVLADGELEDRPDDMETDQHTPERLAAMGDVRRLLENAIDRLPDGFREVPTMTSIPCAFPKMQSPGTAIFWSIPAIILK